MYEYTTLYVDKTDFHSLSLTMKSKKYGRIIHISDYSINVILIVFEKIVYDNID
jgi:hypothetical protein